MPEYFPLDESHPIASIPGRAEGNLDAYNQSKVMAEQLLAYFGTNHFFEAVSLRLAPANSKADQYPADRDFWHTKPGYRRGCFYSNVDPESVIQAIRLALQSSEVFGYEPFNVVDKHVHESINVHDFLAKEYPGVPVRGELSPHQALISSEKAQKILGFKPCEDLK